MDYCECDDCLSVYSPASYFVELLQFLRNNDLDPKNQTRDRRALPERRSKSFFAAVPTSAAWS